MFNFSKLVKQNFFKIENLLKFDIELENANE